MRLAVVCGDGLPVSGLLTTLRNTIELGASHSLVQAPVIADLGYSWRPDKAAFFPSGPRNAGYPSWMEVSTEVPLADVPQIRDRLTLIRNRVANYEALTEDDRKELRLEIDTLSSPYEEYFLSMFTNYCVDWVIAINMTLSDAVPVTRALHGAAERFWSGGRSGGILYWDHDLFGSYGVRYDDIRVYPQCPNPFTPIPGNKSFHRWVVVSSDLADEAASYPGASRPRVVPNVPPTLPNGQLTGRHIAFLKQHRINPARPIILAPVRVFRVKGVEVSIALLSEVKRASIARHEPPPTLLVFGSLAEDPDYAARALVAAKSLRLTDDVRFLDGVPLSSYCDHEGQWHLDECDLLGIAHSVGGGVFFTPNTVDVESVGLGPALAAVAYLPCAVTDYRALEKIYGKEFYWVRVDANVGLEAAADEFVTQMVRRREDDSSIWTALHYNALEIANRFPAKPWLSMLEAMKRETSCVSEAT